MPCYHPIKGYRSASGRFVCSAKNHSALEPMVVPCGGCIGCRLAHSDEHSTRMQLELRYHESAGFVTYTFSDENYPESGSVSVRDVQLLHKAMRNRDVAVAKKEGREPNRFRYVTVSDYSPVWRTHLHEILYGMDFPDLRPWRKSDMGNLLYRSDELDELWGKGIVEVGEVTPQSIAYTARHNMRKVSGKAAGPHYKRFNPVTGELVQLLPEFMLSSRGGRQGKGIASRWFEEFEADVFPSDQLILNGRSVPVPKYFDRFLKDRHRNPGSIAPPAFKLAETVAELRADVQSIDDFSAIRERRAERALDPHQVWNNSPERLEVREQCQILRAERLKRDGVL